MNFSAAHDLLQLTRDTSEQKRPAVLTLDVHWKFVRRKGSKEAIISNVTTHIMAFAVTAYRLVTSRRSFSMPTSSDVNTEGTTGMASAINPEPFVMTMAQYRVKEQKRQILRNFIKEGCYWDTDRITWSENKGTTVKNQTHSDEGQEIHAMQTCPAEAILPVKPTIYDDNNGKTEYSVVRKHFEDYDLITLVSSEAHHRVKLAALEHPYTERSRRCFGLSSTKTHRSVPDSYKFLNNQDSASNFILTVGTWTDLGNKTATATSCGNSLSTGCPLFTTTETAAGEDIQVLGMASYSQGCLEDIGLYVAECIPSATITLLLLCIYGTQIREELKGRSLDLCDIPLIAIPKLLSEQPNRTKHLNDIFFVERDLEMDSSPNDVFREPLRNAADKRRRLAESRGLYR